MTKQHEEIEALATDFDEVLGELHDLAQSLEDCEPEDRADIKQQVVEQLRYLSPLTQRATALADKLDT